MSIFTPIRLLFTSWSLCVAFKPSWRPQPSAGHHFAQAATDVAEYSHILGYGDAAHEPSILQQIVAKRRNDVEKARGLIPEEQLRQLAAELQEEWGGPLDLFQRVRECRPSLAIAAEFKRASPSKGDINVGVQAGPQGLKYADAGAAVISVLTEDKWFKGTLEDMKEVRMATQEAAQRVDRTRPAILRKDFIFDEYQLLEARAYGADTVLLIVAILGRQELKNLIERCRALGMEPLVEVANDVEAEIAALAGARVVGVNNRNLHTFKLDMGTTPRVSAKFRSLGLPFGGTDPDRLLLALSGIMGPEDLNFGEDTAVAGVLVGEALMRASDPGKAVQSLLGDAESVVSSPLVKVCGITNVDDALSACKAGANLIGVIFAKSKRQVDADTAARVVKRVRAFGERDGVLPIKQKILTSPAEDPAGHLRSVGKLIKLSTARRPAVVGVFMDQPIEFILEMIANAGLDMVQLHGDETPETIEAVAKASPVPVVKVLHVDVDAEVASNKLIEDGKQAALAGAAALLLDSSVTGQRGGTGKVFDWNLAKQMGEAGIPVIIAGGLGGEKGQTEACLEHGGPNVLGVDASSGLEVGGRPGVKDAAKVQEYVREARGTQ